MPMYYDVRDNLLFTSGVATLSSQKAKDIINYVDNSKYHHAGIVVFELKDSNDKVWLDDCSYRAYQITYYSNMTNKMLGVATLLFTNYNEANNYAGFVAKRGMVIKINEIEVIENA